ncbi:MAG TPA: FAD-dependent oxidoreductase [Stellaceae bacterium]|nr:FAD-dependent oxidoreductase [Stellaceae bacterium]
MTEAFDAAVIVVGGGPCGLMLANELGRRGVPTLLFNEGAETSAYPRANATQARTMEYFRRLGFAEEVRAQGLPPDYPTDVAYFTRYARHELARFELPSSAAARRLARELRGSWSAAELPHRCSQIYIERVMRAHAARFSSVTLRFGWRVTGFSEDAEGVGVEAEPAEGGPGRRFRARFLAGCDGPRSLLRKQLGFSYRGEGGAVRDFMGGRMHAIYLRAPALYDLLPKRRAWMYWAVNRDRRSLMAALDGREEFVFSAQLKPGEDPDAISEAEARAMFFQTLGAECPIEIVNHLSWTAGLTLVAERFQRGRVFLAGDAVHLFTPTGGLGYNTGIEDAVNLAWKLAAAVEGWGGPGLLATYEAEREPIARRNTGYARRFADSVGLYVPPAEIEAETPAGAAARRAAGDYLDRHARAEFNIPGITFGTRYDASPLIVSDGSAPPPDDANRYLPSAVPGGRAPHAWLPNGRSLFDVLGFGFALLRLGPRAADGSGIAAVARGLRVPLATLEFPSEELRELYGADLVLIRPDQIVAWRGNRVPDDPGAMLGIVTGRSS